MYTVCWIDSNGNDRWDRCQNKVDVRKLLIKEGLEGDEDVLIFGPEADDYTISVGDIL